MRVREIRELSSEEIANKVKETRKEIVDLRFQHAVRKLESPAKLRLARQRLARLLTVQSQQK